MNISENRDFLRSVPEYWYNALMSQRVSLSVLFAPDGVVRGCSDLLLNVALVVAALDPEIPILALHRHNQVMCPTPRNRHTTRRCTGSRTCVCSKRDLSHGECSNMLSRYYPQNPNHIQATRYVRHTASHAPSRGSSCSQPASNHSQIERVRYGRRQRIRQNQITSSLQSTPRGCNPFTLRGSSPSSTSLRPQSPSPRCGWHDRPPRRRSSGGRCHLPEHIQMRSGRANLLGPTSE